MNDPRWITPGAVAASVAASASAAVNEETKKGAIKLNGSKKRRGEEGVREGGAVEEQAEREMVEDGGEERHTRTCQLSEQASNLIKTSAGRLIAGGVGNHHLRRDAHYPHCCGGDAYATNTINNSYSHTHALPLRPPDKLTFTQVSVNRPGCISKTQNIKQITKQTDAHTSRFLLPREVVDDVGAVDAAGVQLERCSALRVVSRL